MKSLLFLFSLLTVVVLFSCRKTKLDDEKEILVGDWKWIYTEEYVDPDLFTSGTLESVIYADSFPKTYNLIFNGNGKMLRVQDGEPVKNRVVVKSWETVAPSWFAIRLRGDNREKKELNMDLLDRATDTLFVDEYPFDDVHDANGRSYYHRNVFVRQ